MYDPILDDETKKALIKFAAVTLALMTAYAIAYPKYNAWRMKIQGQGMLAKAEAEKMILVEQARAELDSAKMQAEAIAIVGQAAQDFPEYREQQFMVAFGNAVEQGDVQMIFVPTEANIPILVKPNLSE